MDYWSSEADDDDIAELARPQSYDQTTVGTQEAAEVLGLPRTGDGEQAS